MPLELLAPLIEMLESVLKILRLKMDASKTTWYCLETLLKTPAEAESTQWEHRVCVCVQHFALESTGFWHSFLQRQPSAVAAADVASISSLSNSV